ncbi:MAG: cysteine desulfurase-like protein [Sandaracinaceae bacterium]
MSLDLDAIRSRFPALSRTHGESTAVYLDGPAGSQVPLEVADAVRHYLLHANANKGGVFATAVDSDAILAEARASTADLLGTPDEGEVIYGPTMRALTLQLSHAPGPSLPPDSHIVLSRMDHDANITPWERMAARHGFSVGYIDVSPDGTLDRASYARELDRGAALVAFTAASNVLGTVTPVAELTEQAHAAGALVFVDAVHYAAHRAMDVRAWGCDFLACSAYKFFAPHVSVLYGRRSLLEALDADQLRPAPTTIPGKWMVGTQSHEGIAGLGAALRYLASLGEGSSRRAQLVDAFDRIQAHETGLAEALLSGLAAMPEITVHGLTDASRVSERAPTVSLTHRRHRPREMAAALAERGIFTWSGHHYALTLCEHLGLMPDGVLRLGPLHYNTQSEVQRVLTALKEL